MIKRIKQFLVGKNESRGYAWDDKRKNKKALVISLALLTASIGTYTTYSLITHFSQSSVLKIVPLEIKGNIVTLRQLKEENFIDFHNMFSETVRKAIEFPETITLNYTIQFLHHLKQKSDSGKVVLYCIFDNKDNKLIGFIEIRDLNDIDPGQLGTGINENYWGGGRFQEALSLISKTYFRLKPDEKSYIAHIRLWNKRSYYALKKAGLQDVGFFYEDGRAARYILEMKRP